MDTLDTIDRLFVLFLMFGGIAAGFVFIGACYHFGRFVWRLLHRAHVRTVRELEGHHHGD